MWFVDETKELSEPQLINDSKTPSGQVHIGSLRGVVLHDVINRSLRARGVESQFIYGMDDMDPLDGLPDNASEQLKANLGKPLCNLAPPEGSLHSNLSEHYAADFIDTFAALGVELSLYRTSKLYRSGKFNQAIEAILNKADIVRDVYLRVSKSQRREDWYPYQVVCENCGKVGSTEVYNFDGKEVQYRCVADYTSWANGCGNQGSVSPYNGNGKLVWKLEWAAKWHTLRVTFEGAGKDHCTKGGSRDVSNACFRRIFGGQPPRNMPYEFFLVSGSKMSSSKGVGESAASMVRLLQPEVMRFLMISTPPKRTVNFATDFSFFVKLFNQYDRLCASNDLGDKQLARMIAVDQQPIEQPVGFQLLTALLQLPHLDLQAEINARFGLSAEQLQDLDKRIATVRTWLDSFAEPADKITIQQQRPASLDQLPAHQCELLRLLADSIAGKQALTDDAMQQVLFDCARLVPCAPREGFIAVYRAFLDDDKGPKAGALLAYLNREMVLERLMSCKVDTLKLAIDTGIEAAALEQQISSADTTARDVVIQSVGDNNLISLAVTAKLANGQTIVRRSLPLNASAAEALSLSIRNAT